VVAGPALEPYGATGQPFNEIVVDAAGRAWVDMPGSMPWEEPKPGIVAVVLPDGTSRQVADDVWFPNGMAVLDDDTLIVAESHADRLTAWTITTLPSWSTDGSGPISDPVLLPTASVWTLRARSGMPAFPDSAVRVSPWG
jgi:sugar lactone lactonase YvrE